MESDDPESGALPEFSNEALLRAAIRSLLIRIPDVQAPQLTHGTLERGKDLVFYLPGGIGRPLLCAAVVKNKPISGQAASPRGAPDLLNQVRQALASPLILDSAFEQRVDRVFVITPYDIPQQALFAIQGELQQLSSQVEFIGAAKLTALFQEYWPDFWLYPDFPKSTNTLYLYILRAELSVRPAQVDGIYVNIISHGSTPARTRACSDTTPRPDALYRALSRLDAVSDQAHVNVTHCQI